MTNRTSFNRVFMTLNHFVATACYWGIATTSMSCTRAASTLTSANRVTESTSLCSPPTFEQSSAVVPSQLGKLPNNGSCVVSGRVERRDVNWKLRTRLDAVATMEVISGDVTAWLFPVRGLPEPNVMANARIENAKIIVHAIVAPDDLRVVLARPLLLRNSVIPDGLTDRVVVSVTEATMRVMFEVPGVEVLSETLPCSYFSVQRSKLILEVSFRDRRFSLSSNGLRL